MSVSSLVTGITYNSDGITGSFPLPFYFIQPQDLLVQSVDVSNNVITYKLNFDYTITGIQNLVGDFPNGGNINFNTPPPNGLTILIQRVTVRTQEVQLIDHGVFNAAVLNHVHDKEMLLIQEGFIDGYLGVALGPPMPTGIPPIPGAIVYSQGNWFKNGNPVLGGVFGWICTTGGSPGIWSSFGFISL